MANTGFVTTGMNSTGPSFFLNGRPLHFIGFNDYDLVVGGRNYSQQFTELQTMAQYGVKVVRCWVYGEGFTTVPGTYMFQYGNDGTLFHESTFVQLDNALAAANALGMRLILTTANNWTDYGGKVEYAKWYNFVNTTTLTADNFHDTPGIFSIYATRLSTLINRTNTVTGVKYNQDPTIFSWECINEGRYTTIADTSPNTSASSRVVAMTAWYNSASSLIRSFDSNHLIGTGGVANYYDYIPNDPEHNGSFYGGDYRIQHNLPNISYFDYHLYPANNFVTAGTDCTCRWTTTYGYEQALADYGGWAQIYGKPVVVGEVGIDKRNTVTGPQVDFYPRGTYFGNYFQDVFHQNMGGVLLWNYDGFVGSDNSYGVQAGFVYTDPSVPVSNQTDGAVLTAIKNTNATLLAQDNPGLVSVKCF